MNRLHIYLPETTIKALRKRADKEGIALSELIRRAVQELLAKK